MLERDFGATKIYNRSKNPVQTRSFDGFSMKEIAIRDGADYSEVFYDQGNIKALPGGIIIAFKPHWDETQIKQWVETQGLVIDKPLLADLNIWLIRSQSGLDGLILANKITEQGEVEYATPNWWQPASTK